MPKKTKRYPDVKSIRFSRYVLDYYQEEFQDKTSFSQFVKIAVDAFIRKKMDTADWKSANIV